MPAVIVGDQLANRIPMKLVHSIAAAIFASLGVATLLGAGAKLGFFERDVERREPGRAGPVNPDRKQTAHQTQRRCVFDHSS